MPAGPAAGGGFAPATKILLWIMLAASMHWLDAASLALVSGLLALALRVTRTAGLRPMLRRTRVLLISLIVIYAFTTPGEAWLPAWGAFSPTPEGAVAGALQAWRLVLLLAALALLLSHCDRECLLGGIYELLRPLRAVKLDPERVAARVWLTLYYAEHEAKGGLREWWRRLQQPEATRDTDIERVVLPLERGSWRDAAVVLLMAAALLALARLGSP